jgi:hypothetical protein
MQQVVAMHSNHCPMRLLIVRMSWMLLRLPAFCLIREFAVQRVPMPGLTSRLFCHSSMGL